MSFNPHTHAGCDYTVERYWFIDWRFQSTHPRRVWPCSFLMVCTPMMFQSTHPRRVWRKLSLKQIPSLSFNPHTHAGCDSMRCSVEYNFVGFNPHTHAGCDHWLFSQISASIVSIHTPTQGVTLFIVEAIFIIMFQSTHPRRVWRVVRYCLRMADSFNPHTHAGCDTVTRI